MLSRYQILDRLGAGGMGVVHRAEDLTLRRPIALKFLSGGPFPREQTKARFLREARTAAALNHPSICTVYEIGEVAPGEEQVLSGGERLLAGTPFIAMELVEGKSLEAMLRQSGPLPFVDLLGIALQVADGMAAAHSRGIVHRDLKPGNVMVTKEDRVKILDFGLAKPVEPDGAADVVGTAADTVSAELTREARVLGTAAYMSPEQAKGETVDSRSDVFSFGVMLYELATGVRPFRGTTTLSTLAKIIEAEPEPIPESRDDLPPEIRRIIRRCLQKKPENRYNDTRDLVAALKALRRETTSEALRIASGAVARTPAWRRWRRLPWAAASLAALLVAAVAVLLVSSGPGGQSTANVLPDFRRITFSGAASQPAISPDGQFLAYVESGEAGPGGVMVRDLSGGEPLRVFESPRASPRRWSPDGTELLVAAGTGGWLVPRLGGTPRRLPFRGYMAWSPDGRRIASVTQAARGITILDKATAQTRTVAVDAPRLFFKDIDWSPAEDLLAFATVAEGGRVTVWTMPAEGGRPNRVADADSVPSVRFSPRGEALYYTTVQEGSEMAVLWKAKIDPRTGRPAGEAEVVLSGFEDASGFSISGDGKTMAYARAQDHSNLWLVEFDRKSAGGVRTTQLTSGTHRDNRPRLAPDGRSVAFLRDRQVFVLQLADGVPRQLTFGGQGHSSPAWSPDGREIAFIAPDGGANRVWIMSAAGGAPRPLSHTVASGDLAWAPSKKILYQRPGNSNFFLLDPVTGDETPLLRDESRGWLFAPVFSPDGGRIVVYWNPRAGPDKLELRARVISLDATLEQPLGADPSVRSYPVGWSADGAWVYLLMSADNDPVIVKAPATGGAAVEVLKLPFKEISTPATMDDRLRFVVSVADRRSDIWIVRNFDREAE